VRPFFAYPAEIRQGDVHHQRGGVFEYELAQGDQDTRLVSQRAALKLLYFGPERVAKKWTRPLQDWKAALNRFAIIFEDRAPQASWQDELVGISKHRPQRGGCFLLPWPPLRPKRSA